MNLQQIISDMKITYDHLYLPGEDIKKRPAAILTMENYQKLDYFRRKVISHPHLDKVTSDVLEQINQKQFKILHVVGPARIGKTTLLRKVVREIIKRDKALNREDDKGKCLLGIDEAIPPHKGHFLFDAQYVSLMRCLGEPEELIQNKINTGKNSEGKFGILRKSLISCINNRRPDAILIDESQYFAQIPDIREAMEELKSLSNGIESPLVLFGTYESLDLLNLSAQLGLRSKEFPLNRYLSEKEDAENYRGFTNALYAFQDFLPLPDQSHLENFHKEIYIKCSGCIGILKEWLFACLADLLKTGGTIITEEILDRNCFPFSKIEETSIEIAIGEQKLKRREWDKEREDYLYALLENGIPDNAQLNIPNNPDGNHPKGRRGKRNITRDQFGGAWNR